MLAALICDRPSDTPIVVVDAFEVQSYQSYPSTNGLIYDKSSTLTRHPEPNTEQT